MENFNLNDSLHKGLTFIYASDEHHGIGYRGILPWRNTEDLREFKRTTSEIPEGFNEPNKVVMGVNTLLSLKQPLPNRINIVLYDSHRITKSSEMCLVSLTERFKEVIFMDKAVFKQEVLDGKHDAKNTFCIGGCKTYEYLESLCVRLIHTSIKGVYLTDTKYAFPVKQYGFELVDKTYLETCYISYYLKS